MTALWGGGTAVEIGVARVSGQDRNLDASVFLERGKRFRAELRALKQRLVVPDYGWYPYESLSALEILTRLLEPVFEEVAEGLTSGPIADIGCGDGDLGLFCAYLGGQVDAIDHLESNFNQMRGIDVLREALGLTLDAHNIDLDGRFELPRSDYKFAFFLGTLYHLKNPYYVLESLASRADWCVLSTRIARVTPHDTPIEEEPIAYLLDAREANNDPTNYWIFSAAGLLRLLCRAGWMVLGHERAGQALNSNPVDAGADERMFVLLKSRVRHPDLLVRPLYGWYAPEGNAWRWTAKSFGLEVVPPADGALSEFALQFEVPAALLEVDDQVRVTCAIEGDPAGSVTCTRAERLEFRGRFPTLSTRRAIRLAFKVESSYSPGGGDTRELGVIVPLLEERAGNTHRVPFRVS
jgi:SAM-dependent methyltransferase